MSRIRAPSRDGRRRLDRAGRAYWCSAALALLAALTALPAAAADFTLSPGQQVVGAMRRYVTKKGDIFPDLARRFDIGYTELVTANPGVDPWLPGVGRTILVPSLYILPDAPRRGIVVNLAQWRLFYFPPGGKEVETYPIGIGVIGWKTPIGVTRVVRKEKNPVWYPPPSIRAQRPDLPALVPAGPDNPLGLFALHLGWPNYLIHGTNKPDGVGRNVSHGCIHLYPEDIARLFAAVKVGTPVRTVDQPAVAGWKDDALYLAVHPSQKQVEEIDTDKPVARDPARGVLALVRKAAGPNAAAIDRSAVEEAANRRTGVPVRVAERAMVANSAAGPQESGTRIEDRDSGPDAVRSYDPGAVRSYDPDADQSYSPDADQSYDRDADTPYPDTLQSYGGGSAPSEGSEAARPDGAGSDSRARASSDPQDRILDQIERSVERASEQ